jgi:DNA-binding NarL/FixJ family response regulator
VVVLTTSTDPQDIAECYHMGANSYSKKAVEFERFFQSIKRFSDYCFDVVVLPSSEQ